MPRTARKNSRSSYYHVIVQGINKECIFKTEDYIKKYKHIIRESLKKSDLKILAYCIMNNHTHFLIYSEKTEDLSKYMQKINTSYANFYNKINKRVGYLYRNRYFSKEILSKRQLYTCLKYIHNNPVKAKMVEKMGDYKYSSYNEFFGEKSIINKTSIKLLFDNASDFKEQFILIHNTDFGEKEDFDDIKEKDIKDFIIEVEKIYNKPIKEIKKDKEILKEVIRQAREETEVTLYELGKILGLSKSTVGSYVKK